MGNNGGGGGGFGGMGADGGLCTDPTSLSGRSAPVLLARAAPRTAPSMPCSRAEAAAAAAAQWTAAAAAAEVER